MLYSVFVLTLQSVYISDECHVIDVKIIIQNK